MIDASVPTLPRASDNLAPLERSKPIPPRRRALLLSLAGDDPRNLHYIHQIYCHIRCDEIAEWLIRARLTGAELRAWVEAEHAGAIFGAIAEIVRRLEREEKARPVTFGRDYRPGGLSHG